MLENTLPHILDTSALDDLEESDFDDNETKTDVTTTLVAVDAETSNCTKLLMLFILNCQSFTLLKLIQQTLFTRVQKLLV